MSLDLAYFYGSEAEQYSFYRIPKILLTDRRYKGVSMEAKVLYGLMLDRMGLSVRSGWLDDEGRVYIYFTLDDALAMLGCGKDKAVRLFKELDVSGGIGLIERRKQGQGRPAPSGAYLRQELHPAARTRRGYACPSSGRPAGPDF